MKTLISTTPKRKYSVLPRLILSEDEARRFEHALENPKKPNKALRKIFQQINSRKFEA